MYAWACAYACSVKSVCVRLARAHTPSYLPSYTRLGHAIPGSKTVSVGVCAREHQPATTRMRDSLAYKYG